MTSPLVSRYAVRALMWPLGRKAPVTLGRRNAERNPRRTSATASALMISVALISGLIVIAASAKASIEQNITDAIGTSELVVSSDDPSTFSPQIADRIARVSGSNPSIGSASSKPRSATPQSRSAVSATARSMGRSPRRSSPARLDGLAPRSGAPPPHPRQDAEVVAGKTFDLTTTTGKHKLTVAGILAPNRQLNAIVLSLPAYDGIGGAPTDSLLYVDVAQSTGTAQAGQAILGELKDYPTIRVRDQQAYVADARGPVNVVLGVIGMLLALAILIAILGIVNTLALGVVERTREIGLLRAIGMDRPQLSRMLRVESIAISLLGALLGLVIGVVFAAAVQRVWSTTV